MRRPKLIAPKRIGQQGFTIVELMVATLVFSVILLVITMGVLSFTHAYYSGLNSSATQNAARNIVNTVAQSIQFSGDPIAVTQNTNNLSFFCIGNVVYVFMPGKQFVTDNNNTFSDPGLLQVASTGCPSASQLQDLSLGNAKQLLGKNMRITNLTVARLGGTNSYTIDLRIAYGDSDLLCNTGDNSHQYGCSKGDSDYALDPSVLVKGDDVECKLQTGFQFCAVAGLTTTVAIRVSTSAS